MFVVAAVFEGKKPPREGLANSGALDNKGSGTRFISHRAGSQGAIKTPATLIILRGAQVGDNRCVGVGGEERLRELRAAIRRRGTRRINACITGVKRLMGSNPFAAGRGFCLGFLEDDDEDEEAAVVRI